MHVCLMLAGGKQECSKAARDDGCSSIVDSSLTGSVRSTRPRQRASLRLVQTARQFKATKRIGRDCLVLRVFAKMVC